MADRKVADKVADLADRKMADRVDPAGKETDREDHKADREDHKAAVLEVQTVSSRLTEVETHKADRTVFQTIKEQEEEEAEASIIRNNTVGEIILGIMVLGEKDNTHRITKAGEVMIAKAIIK